MERSRLNKEKLLEIAKKNAAKILKSGGDYLGMDTVRTFSALYIPTRFQRIFLRSD